MISKSVITKFCKGSRRTDITDLPKDQEDKLTKYSDGIDSNDSTQAYKRKHFGESLGESCLQSFVATLSSVLFPH